MELTEEQKRNVRNFRRLFDEGFTKGDVTVVDELLSPNLREHMSMDHPTREGVKELIRNLHFSFPDFRCEPEDIVVGEDKVWGRVKGGGTDQGGFMGHPPTGRRATTASIDVCRFEDGKVVEHWGIVDLLGTMAQLGLVLPPGGGRRAPKEL